MNSNLSIFQTPMDFMQRAFALAKKGNGHTSPNPSVGAVFVRAGKVIGEGRTRPVGGPHAEVVAVRDAKKYGFSLRGSTLYVTMEPCSHVGRTPPCSDLLIQEGVKKVVVAVEDSFEKVRRGGIKEMKKHGIDVQMVSKKSDLYKEIRAFYQSFIKWAEVGLPYVVMKVATSLDGKIATRTGESQWITSELARKDARIERSLCDAVLVGAGTVRADNPELASHGKFAKKHLLRVIIDPDLSLDPKKFQVFRDEHVFVATTNRASEDRQKVFRDAHIAFECFGVDAVSVKKFLQHLGQQFVTKLFVEGGAGIHGMFYDESLSDPLVLDEVLWYIAPMIIGGKESLSAVGGEGSKSLKVRKLESLKVESVGEDLKIKGSLNFY